MNKSVNQSSSGAGNDISVGECFVFYGEVVAQPTILLVGLVTNIISLSVLPRVKMPGTFKACLMALATSDVCACASGACQELVKGEHVGKSAYGYYATWSMLTFSFCFIFLFFMSFSGCLVVVIASVRTFVSLKPLKAKGLCSGAKISRICLGVLLANLAVYCPCVIDILYMSCSRAQTPFCVNVNATLGLKTIEAVTNIHLYTVSLLYGPVLFAVYFVCVILTWITLKHSAREVNKMAADTGTNDNAVQRQKSAVKVTSMLLIMLISDMVCTLPVTCYGIWLAVKPKGSFGEYYQVFEVAAEIVYCFRPTYNFWVYFFHNANFRNALYQTCPNRGRSGSIKSKTSVQTSLTGVPL